MYGLMPSSIAFVSTKVLNAEPAWRRPWAARLNWRFLRSCATAVIDRMAPFAGLIETSAEAGSVGSLSVSFIARMAAAW